MSLSLPVGTAVWAASPGISLWLLRCPSKGAIESIYFEVITVMINFEVPK